MPKISCVMPTRDRAEIINDAIQSIVEQTEKDWELIIVDDHSKSGDGTEKIARLHNDPRIKYYKLPDENGSGISAARNFGNMMAQSKYIAVCDSDDVFYPDRFEVTLDCLKRESCDIFYSDIDYWYPEENKIEKYHSRKFNLDDFKRFDFIPNISVCYRREIVLDFPYNSFFRKAEDYDFFWRVYRHGYKFYYCDKSLVKYRKHSGSITAAPSAVDYPQIVRNNNQATF